MENWTWENVLTIRAMTPLVICYLLLFWGIPMLGTINHRKLPKEDLLPYWTAVWQISALFHFGAILVSIVMWIIYPYMVPS